jgi:hypothetical protein
MCLLSLLVLPTQDKGFGAKQFFGNFLEAPIHNTQFFTQNMHVRGVRIQTHDVWSHV